MREIVFDTETTGLSPQRGDRLIEIGCVELIDKKPTGKEFHAYCHPETTIVGAGAYDVHKISMEFLEGKPFFRDIAQDLLDFIGDATLVAHNARFDMGFVNMELERAGRKAIPSTQVIDTLWIARKRVPDLAKHTLDYLCDHFGIDKTEREDKGHGALLDSQILAEVYFALVVDREQKLFSAKKDKKTSVEIKREFKEPRSFEIPVADLENHMSFISGMKKTFWKKGE
ncbi:MAG: DNA polymerase III subunit epsilon [Alphaproteobacteria bacterium]|nr:DNA polymerase III subunit epsilon [Alphaproteobacteria bacterium]MBN2779596.1 DNA polymerase III subunit epsilon [Alphaproteobacteria bacterium]